MRLPHTSGVRLKRLAASHGWTPSDTSARLVEEGLRRAEFACIDFRDSVVGRQACIQGSSLAVWEVMFLARNYQGSAMRVARHLEWPEARVQAAFNYAKAFPGEIGPLLAEQDAANLESLSRLLPQLREFNAGKPREK